MATYGLAHCSVTEQLDLAIFYPSLMKFDLRIQSIPGQLSRVWVHYEYTSSLYHNMFKSMVHSLFWTYGLIELDHSLIATWNVIYWTMLPFSSHLRSKACNRDLRWNADADDLLWVEASIWFYATICDQLPLRDTQSYTSNTPLIFTGIVIS